MLQERLNEPFKMVSWRELAQIEHDDLSDDVIAQYIETRDLSVLPPLDQLDPPPSVFSCLPLQTEFENLLNPTIEGDQGAAWQLFASHVTSAQNYNSSDGSPMLDWKMNKRGRKVVRDKCRKKVILLIRNEITGVITDKAAVGDYGPFELPGSFFRDMIRYRARRAMNAAKDGATNPADKSTKKDQTQ